VLGSPSVIGKVLCEHPDVPVLSFTGSTEVGKQLIEDTKSRVKRLSLELGGNAPFVVFADADLESAADQLLANKFRGGGQTCVCTNRVLAEQSVAERFAELVRTRVEKLKVGNGMEADTDIGPLIDRAGWSKVHEHVTDALQRGARLVIGGDPKQPEGNVKAYYPPTVLSHVTPEMACWREETFGPLVPIAEFSSEAQAVEQANDTEYGLAAYVFTRDEARAARFISRLQFGHVGWNTGNGPTPEAPFGGMKESGYGREGGLEGMHEFTEVQVVTHP
jgi:succinate-semialdehyde dehydrogenase/glutarate-semialdehyde dehydrogenase